MSGAASEPGLTFSESFHCRLLFSGKAKNSPTKFERLKPLLGWPNRSNFFSDANYSFMLLLKHSRMHEAFQIISQKTVVGCPWLISTAKHFTDNIGAIWTMTARYVAGYVCFSEVCFSSAFYRQNLAFPWHHDLYICNSCYTDGNPQWIGSFPAIDVTDGSNQRRRIKNWPVSALLRTASIGR